MPIYPYLGVQFTNKEVLTINVDCYRNCDFLDVFDARSCFFFYLQKLDWKAKYFDKQTISYWLVHKSRTIPIRKWIRIVLCLFCRPNGEIAGSMDPMFGSYLHLKIEFLLCSWVASLITIDISFYKLRLLLSQCNVYFGRSFFRLI